MTQETFGQRFKALRKEKKLTQEKIAKLFYLNTSSISKYEKDCSMPENALLIQFSDFFDVSVDYLLCCTDIRQRIHPEKTGPVWIDASGEITPIQDDERSILKNFRVASPEIKKEIEDFIHSKTAPLSCENE